MNEKEKVKKCLAFIEEYMKQAKELRDEATKFKLRDGIEGRNKIFKLTYDLVIELEKEKKEAIECIAKLPFTNSNIDAFLKKWELLLNSDWIPGQEIKE